MDKNTINPATEEVLQSYTYLTKEQIEKQVSQTHQAYLSWRKTPMEARKQSMSKLARVLNQQKKELALLISQEMGKPITAALGEIEKCEWLVKHYVDEVDNYLSPQIIKTEMALTKVCYQPQGIVFGIMPWNFPFWQVFRFAIPTMIAGNAAILKHAAITLGCGNKIEALFLDSGFPQHLFSHLLVDSEGAATIIEQPSIIGITLTGSNKAGSEVASHAGKCLKKTVMELGGSDPYVVLADADLDIAAKFIVTSRLNNCGQVCIAAKRVIAIESIREELTKKIQQLMLAYKPADPLDPKTLLGPMARSDLRKTLHNQVEKSIKLGAKLLSGGIIPQGKGFYYPPTLLTEVTPGMPAFDEELFGPVITIISANDERQAIDYANQSEFGLGAAVFTQDLAKGERIASYEIEAGSCFVNSLVASDPRVPFGGIKQSGYGRELAREGILEFLNVKTVAINDPNDKKQ